MIEDVAAVKSSHGSGYDNSSNVKTSKGKSVESRIAPPTLKRVSCTVIMLLNSWNSEWNHVPWHRLCSTSLANRRTELDLAFHGGNRAVAKHHGLESLASSDGSLLVLPGLRLGGGRIVLATTYSDGLGTGIVS